MLMLFIVLLSLVTTLCQYQILERQISGCECEKYEPSVGTKIS